MNDIQSKICRLCVENCTNHISLLDEKGLENEQHRLMVKYFDTKYFTDDKEVKLNVMCTECWRHIYDFHNFQQFVYHSQKKLSQDVYHISEIQFVPDNNIPSQDCQDVCVKLEADECLGETPSGNAVGAYVLEDEQRTQFALPKLELMDVLPDSDDNSDGGNSSLLIDSDRNFEYNNVEFEKCDKRIDITYETYTNQGNLSEGCSSDLDEFEELCTSDSESLLTECEDNSENAPEPVTFKKEITSKSSASDQNIYKRRSAEDLDKFVAQWRPMLECVACNGSFPKLTLLQQHFRENHPQDAFYVLCCGSKLRYACRIEDHITHHIDPTTYRCQLCRRCYKSRINLELHRRKYHHSSSFVGKGFKMDKCIDSLIAKWKNKIGCALCSYNHSSLINLRQHFEKEHAQEEFHILCCDRKLKKRRRILEHMRYHVNPNVFKCQSCDICFDSRTNLITHMQNSAHTSKSGSRRYAKEDKEIDDLLAQWKSPVECAICSDAYSSLTLLRQHFQIKHRQHSFYYVCCRVKLKERGRILEHIRYHINPNAFKCDVCDKRYKYEKNLNLHKRSHDLSTTNESVKTPIENITEKDVDNLVLQWKRNMNCDVCNASFPTYTFLHEHFAQEHSTQDIYVICCKRKLEGLNDIAEHIRYHIDPNAFKCDICDRRYKYENKLILHKLSHSAFKKRTQKDLDDLMPQWKQNLSCVICSTSFTTYTLLRGHFSAEHPGKKFYFTCCKRKLERVYDIAEHIRYHINPNVHKCNLCEKLYKHAKNLKIHVQRDHPELQQNVRNEPQLALQELNNGSIKLSDF